MEVEEIKKLIVAMRDKNRKMREEYKERSDAYKCHSAVANALDALLLEIQLHDEARRYAAADHPQQDSAQDTAAVE